MRAVLAWLRLDLRRRRRSLVVLALLLAFSGALVMAVTAGARRNSTALERLRAQTLPATAVILPNALNFPWDKVRALPDVEALGLFSLTGRYAIRGLPDEALGFPLTTPDFYTTLERPVVLQGRMMDSSKADEAVVNEPFLARAHAKLGDTFTAQLYTPAQIDAANESGDDPDPSKAAGPTQQLRIVGVVRFPWIFEFSGGDDSGIQPSYAFTQKYLPNIIGTHGDVQNGLVRLRGGEQDLPRFVQEFAQATGRANVEISDLSVGAKKVTNATSFEGDALLLFALAAAIAATLIVGQAIVRYSASAITDLEVLRALGMTRREAVVAASAGPLLAGAAAALVAVACAYAASSLFPIGVGGTIEPDPGRHADWVVLLPGAIVMVGIALSAAAMSSVAASARRSPDRTPHRSVVAATAARLGLPVPLSLGTRLALEPGRGRTAVPVRPALVGAVVGVLGIVAAATFHAGLTDAVNTPERYGQTYQLSAFLGFNAQQQVDPKTEAAAVADPAVAGANDQRVEPVQSGGHSFTAFELNPLKGGVPTVSLEGRAPRTPDEIALGPATARQLDVGVGDRITVTGEKQHTFTVTGITFVPVDFHTTYDDGAWLTTPAVDQMFPDGYFKYRELLVRVAPGTDTTAFLASFTKKYQLDAQGTTPPGDIENLRTVNFLPLLLGGFLALLAIGAVGHALATAVRRRGHDMAVLRALGLTRPQVRATVAWQATTLAAVGIVFGIPLGVALGRTVWRVVADRTPVQYVPPLAVLVILLVIPAALVVANLLAAYPGHRAVRQRIGHVLRAE